MEEKKNENHIFLKNFILHFVNPTNEEWDDFLNVINEENFDKGDFIVSSSKPCSKLYLIIEGIARHYIIDKIILK